MERRNTAERVISWYDIAPCDPISKSAAESSAGSTAAAEELGYLIREDGSPYQQARLLGQPNLQRTSHDFRADVEARDGGKCVYTGMSGQACDASHLVNVLNPYGVRLLPASLRRRGADNDHRCSPTSSPRAFIWERTIDIRGSTSEACWMRTWAPCSTPLPTDS